VVDRHPAFFHQLFDMPVTQRLGDIPAHAYETVLAVPFDFLRLHYDWAAMPADHTGLLGVDAPVNRKRSQGFTGPTPNG